MSSDTRRTRGVQSGPRSKRIVNSVREATLSELARVGYAGLSVDAIAQAAGVHRTTIYRRWPTKQDLVEALIEPEVARIDGLPPGDCLADDLRAVSRQLAANMLTPEGLAISRVMMVDDPDLADLGVKSQQQLIQAFERPFRRAIDRGEISTDSDVEVLVHLLFSGVLLWVRERSRAPTEDELVRLVAPVAAAAQVDRITPDAGAPRPDGD